MEIMTEKELREQIKNTKQYKQTISEKGYMSKSMLKIAKEQDKEKKNSGGK